MAVIQPDRASVATHYNRPHVLLLGPDRTAVSGVSTHVNQILSSSLVESYAIEHYQIGSEGRQEGPLEKLLRFAFSPLALAFKLVRSRTKLVHLNTSMNAKAFWRDAIYALVAKALGKKVVYQMHGGDLPHVFFRPGSVGAHFLSFLLPRLDAVVVLGSQELTAYRQIPGIRRLALIPNAIDTAAFGHTAKPFGEAVLKLGYIGRLHAGKGLFELVDALQLLIRQGLTDFELTLAGSGEAEEALRQRVLALGLQDRVRFAGALFGEAKQGFWRDTDVLVFPSHAEGLPYTVLESLASGTPMVVTAVGAIPDVVTPGVHGLFVEPKNPQAIARAVTELARDRQRLHDMSEACRRHAREHFDVARLADQLRAVYVELVDRR